MNDLFEPAVEGETPLPSKSLCPNCGSLFPYRSNKTYCSPNCRKVHANRVNRRSKPENASASITKARQQYEKFELAARMAERLYSMSGFDRLGYLETIVRLARDGHSPIVRDILTTPQLYRPNPEEKYLFFRRSPASYCTISQAANRYCLWSPWKADVVEVVRGIAPEPPTGEVCGDGVIDDGEGFGMKSVITHNKREDSAPRVHPWYNLGDEYPHRLRRYVSTDEPKARVTKSVITHNKRERGLEQRAA